MPLTFLGGHLLLLLRTSAWAWMLDLVALALVLVVLPLHPQAVRSLLPYLLFLAIALVSISWATNTFTAVQTFLQVTVPAIAYLVAWHVGRRGDAMTRRIARTCLLVLAPILLLWALGMVGVQAVQLSLRPVAISLAIIFVLATLDARSWRKTAAVAAVAVLVTATTGSRMATLVIVVLLLLSPQLHVRPLSRVLIGSGLVGLLVYVSQTAAFQDRFFFGAHGSLLDVLTLSPTVNTAGRREVWPQLIETCSSTPLLGRGIGASYELATRISGGGINQPHNDYIRTFCDVGLTGSMLLWGFFVAMGLKFLARSRSAAHPSRDLQAAAGLVILAFLVFALTDNPLVYTAHFMAPMAVVLGLADGRWFQPVTRPSGLSRGEPACVR